MAGLLAPSNTNYPNVNFGDHDRVVRNCEALGIPVPLVAWVQGNNFNIGSVETGRPQAGSRRDITYTRNSATGATPAQPSDCPLPVLRMDGSPTANRAFLTQALAIKGPLTVLTIVTNRLQAASRQIVYVGASLSSGGADTDWFIGGNNALTTTDYKVRFTVGIGVTLYNAVDPNTWANGERLVVCGTRIDTEMKLYREGNLVATQTCATGNLNTARTQTDIGGFSDNGNFNSQVDVELILIWDKGLSADQVAFLSANPYALWNDLDDETDDTVLIESTIKLGDMVGQIYFFQTLSTQGFNVKEITSGTVTSIPGGGRQILRTPGGTLWHSYYEGGALRASYSDDEGQTWTVVNVGPTWVPAGIAMCVGASGEPVIAVSSSVATGLFFYEWDGSAFQYAGTHTTTSRCQSFQIAWDGTYYITTLNEITVSGPGPYSGIPVRRSSDLATWTGYDGTNIYLLSSVTTSGSVYRMLAMCLDPSGDIHLAYCVKLSTVWKLYYVKITNYVVGTVEEVATGGTGVNVSDVFSGLSIAIDDLAQVHLVCRQRGTIYTGRVRVAYYRQTTSWSAVEYIHSDVDADQGFPSLSLNLHTARVAWASLALGLAAVCAKRGSDGTWSYEQITSNTRYDVNTVHGPSYGSSYNYSRGVVGSMRGSEEYFYSSDAIAGNAATMETTINFVSILSTQHRVMANSIAFSSSLTATRAIGLRSTINFTQRLNFTRERSMAGTITFTQHLEGGVNVFPITQTINFTSSLSGVKSPLLYLSHTINFVSRLNRTVTGTLSNSIHFSGLVFANVIKRKSMSSTLNFSSVLGLNFSVKKVLTGVINFIVGLVAMKGDEGCETPFVPERPLPASEDDVEVVYLIGPLPSLALTVQLKRPEYGNSRRQSLQIKANRTRGGKLRVHARTPTYEPQPITFESLSYLKLEEVRNFLRVCKGKKCYYLDEKNRKWIGYYLTSDVDLSEEARDRGGQFQLEFEGVLV